MERDAANSDDTYQRVADVLLGAEALLRAVVETDHAEQRNGYARYRIEKFRNVAGVRVVGLAEIGRGCRRAPVAVHAGALGERGERVVRGLKFTV